MIKIGITEQGDPALDLSWIEQLDKVDGAIVVSKGYNSKFNKALLEHKDKLIYHCTMTGLGGTAIEPKVPSVINMVGNIGLLIRSGFPARHMVLRMDPILPEDIFIKYSGYTYKEYLHRVYSDILKYFCIRRFRYSWLDIYPHVRDRFTGIADLPDGRTVSQEDKEKILTILSTWSGISIEACGEPDVPGQQQIGCVSYKDMQLLGYTVGDVVQQDHPQRDVCLCCKNKTELLHNKQRCYHGCLYCYWHDAK